MPEPGGDYIVRADALDDDLQAEEIQRPEKPVKGGGKPATLKEPKPATRLACAVCGLDAGTCGHSPGLTTEVTELCPPRTTQRPTTLAAPSAALTPGC